MENNERHRITESIIKREKQIRFNRAKSYTYILTSAATILILALIANISFIPHELGKLSDDTVGYGAALVSADTGSYVFIAVISFILGTVITLLSIQLKKYLRLREQNKEPKNTKEI